MHPSFTVKGRTGVHHSTRCRVCKITAAESVKRGPVDTGINHPVYCQTYSFYQNEDRNTSIPVTHLCPRCHREQALKSLFATMDARDVRKKTGRGR